MKSIAEEDVSFKLIKELNNPSKPNFSKIENKLDISRKTLLNTFQELREKKTINNYTININPNIRPSLRYVFLEIKTNPQEPELVKDLLKIPQLKKLDGIFGDFSLIALFVIHHEEEYYEILNSIDKIMARSYFKKYQIFEAIRTFKINGLELSRFQIDPNINITEEDRLILNILQNHQDQNLISTYEIKEILKNDFKTEISQPTISNKIRALRDANVILNYTINFCPRRIGYKGKYIVRIKPKDPSKYDELALKLEKNSNITDLFRIGDQYGLLAVIRVKNIEDYGIFIKELYDTEEIEDTWTNFILDELIPYTNFKLE